MGLMPPGVLDTGIDGPWFCVEGIGLVVSLSDGPAAVASVLDRPVSMAAVRSPPSILVASAAACISAAASGFWLIAAEMISAICVSFAPLWMAV